MSNYLERTRNGKEVRSFGGMLEILDKEFARTAHEHALGKLNLWSSFERRDQETLRGYWLRYDRIMQPLSKAGIHMPEEIFFNKALASIKLSAIQMSTLLSTLESKDVTKNVVDIKNYEFIK